MLFAKDFRIRDPFVVPVEEEGIYYMYGSTDDNTWGGKAQGFNAYRSVDLVNWEGPFPVFRPEPGFWSEQDYWAPEVHRYQGRYFMFASFKAEGVCRGTQILVSDGPLGPFKPHSDGPVTPRDWECLDGTLYIDNQGNPWMVFCHEWVQIQDGTMCALPLKQDLSAAAGEPVLLFHASEAPWGNNYPDQGNFVTDGPFMYRAANDELLMIWSSFGERGYAVGVARSASGEIAGPWQQDETPLFAEDGGHGMLFKTFKGHLMLTFHQPNETPNERHVIFPVNEIDGSLEIATR